MKLDIPDEWSHDFDISKCGKFITLKLSIPDVSEMVGHRARKIVIRGMFDCYQFKDSKVQQTLVLLIDELNRKYHGRIEICQ
ncbi:hypothetical protein EGS82_05655 [Escherichia coli]|nr:hypothetical protein EGS82_05655 [Escherichia coli]